MRISVNMTNFSWPDGIGALGKVVRAADEAGVDTVWVSDHLVQADPFATLDEPMLEAYTTLGYLAASTSTVRLGTMVAGATFRPPALLVKAVTTLDVLSGGRAWLGIGAGHHEVEARMMGLPFPATAERFERLEETLQIAHRMWAGDESPFEGRHYRLERPLNIPNAATRPRILVGGMVRRRPCATSRGTPTPATCRTFRTAAPPSGTSLTCCAGTATRSAGRSTRSIRRSAPGSTRRPSRSAARTSRASASVTSC